MKLFASPVARALVAVFVAAGMLFTIGFSSYSAYEAHATSVGNQTLLQRQALTETATETFIRDTICALYKGAHKSCPLPSVSPTK